MSDLVLILTASIYWKPSGLNTKLGGFTMKYNLSIIMRRAHEIRRAASYDGIPAHWPTCLSMAWEEAKAPNAAPMEEAQTVTSYKLRAVSTLRDAGDITAHARAAVYKAAKRDGEFLSLQDVEELGQDTILRVYESLTDSDKIERLFESRGPVPFGLVVWRCARAAWAKHLYHTQKTAAAAERVIEDGEGNEVGEISMQASPINVEEISISKATQESIWEKVEELGDDVTAVFRLLVAGVTERDIAERLGMTKSGVHRRIVKAREAARAVLVA